LEDSSGERITHTAPVNWLSIPQTKTKGNQANKDGIEVVADYPSFSSFSSVKYCCSKSTRSAFAAQSSFVQETKV
jgi:hypothetical protein